MELVQWQVLVLAIFTCQFNIKIHIDDISLTSLYPE